MEHTFAGDREKDTAARPSYVRYCQVPYKVYLRVLTTDKETYLEH